MYLLQFVKNGQMYTFISPYLSTLMQKVKVYNVEKYRVRDKSGWFRSAGDWADYRGPEPQAAVLLWYRIEE